MVAKLKVRTQLDSVQVNVHLSLSLHGTAILIAAVALLQKLLGM
jgi:hypothetical protein